MNTSCRSLPRALLLSLLLLALAGCGGSGGGSDTGGDNGGDDTTPDPTSVVFSISDTLGMRVGDVKDNPATPFGTGALHYSSDDESIATINDSGTVTAYAIGTTTLTVEQDADDTHAASSDTVIVNVVADTFTLTAWLGQSDTRVSFSAGMEGTGFYRSTDVSCDLANYASCANGQLDILDGSTVTDTAATADRSAFYTFVNGDAEQRLDFAVEELPYINAMEIVPFKGQLYSVGGWTGFGAGGGDDVWVSNDGRHWMLLTDSAGFAERKDFGSAVFNNRLWITSGYVPDEFGFYNNLANDVWSSSDGISWSEATASAAFGVRTHPNLVAFDGKLWLISGYGPLLVELQDAWSSVDGTTWTQESADIGFTARDVVEFNGALYATSEKGVWHSSDAVNWTELTAAAGYTRADGLAVHDGKLWVVSYENDTDSETWSSPDGIAWTQQPVTQSYKLRYDFRLLDFNDRLFMLGGEFLLGAEIEDHWFLENDRWQRAAPGAAFRARYRHSGVSFNDKLWVIAGKAYGDVYLNDAWSSTDGINWTEETASAAFNGRFGQQVVEFDGKLWLYGGENAGGDLGDAWSSTDGVAWTAETADALLATRRDYGLVAFNGTLWMLGGVSTSDDSYLDEVWHSTNGVDWTEDAGSNFPVRSKMALAVFDGKLWMIGGEEAENTYKSDAWYSSDGVNWTRATADAGFFFRAWPQAYVIGDRLHVTSGGVLESATVYSSIFNDIWSTADGVNWTEDTADAAFPWLFHNPVVAKDGVLWMLGGSVSDSDFEKIIWRSTDGVTWRRPMPLELDSPQ